ncbi:hypothetical protein L6452_22144 [Arctium lappa]|uniref:Uncharacterized protein n=1 Tax=Arctium lappa TaxID=4217 RepID=A0ACB9AYK6_ARCLA|nr:hypothetical protein L6452_22144 [Arctium lappa]
MFKISEVLGIKLGHTKCKNFWFYDYVVKREDGVIWTFTYVDLPNLHPRDLSKLFKWTEERYGWKREYQEAHSIIKKTMREKLLYYSVVDFQVALDLGVKRVNLTSPEDSLPPFATILPNFIINAPNFGLVYINPKGKHKIFMGIESQKYSTRSLLNIQEKIIKHRGTPLVPVEAADVLLENISATLSFRDLCAFYYREMKKEGGFGRRINDFPDTKI